MSKSWAMMLAFAAVVATSCSGQDSAEPTPEGSTVEETTSSASAAPSTADEAGNLMWDLSAAPGDWAFARPEYPALAVYHPETAACTATFDTVQLLLDGAEEAEVPVDSDSTTDAALLAYAEKTGLAPDALESSAADPLEVPVTGTEETLELVGRNLTAPDAAGFAYGYSDGVLALSVVVLCESASVDDPAGEVGPFLADLALVQE